MPLLPLIEGRMQISIESLFYFQPYPCQQKFRSYKRMVYHAKGGYQVKWLERNFYLLMSSIKNGSIIPDSLSFQAVS